MIPINRIKIKTEGKGKVDKFLFGHTLQAVFITANSAVVTGTVKNSLVLRILLTTSAKKHINNWKKKG